MQERKVRVSAGPVTLEGSLGIPNSAGGVVLFAHGSGSGRHSPRNRYVARVLRESNLATLLIDLLTEDEEEVDLRTTRLRFDIELLARRTSRPRGRCPAPCKSAHAPDRRGER